MVSIIVPCFNIEGSIDATFRSVLNQTKNDWEIIGVDDGSTDSTLDKLKAYSQMDDRIRYIHQDNRGVSAARNAGLKAAKGDIIYFLDGDDIVDPSLVEKLIAFFQSDTDMVVFGYKEELLGKRYRIHSIGKIDSEDLLGRFLTNRISIHICSSAFSRNFIESSGLNFDLKTAFSEDREFLCKALWSAKSVVVLRDVLYTYTYQESSSMRRKIYDKRKYSSILASERMYKLLVGTDFEMEALIQLKTVILLHHRFILHNKINRSEITDKLMQKSSDYLHLYSIPHLYRDAIFAFFFGYLYRLKWIFKRVMAVI